MKRTRRWTALALAVMLLAGMAPAALAETMAGSTAEKKTFYVKATQANAFIVLNSSPGLANVRQYDRNGNYTGIGQETVHGFYLVSISGPGGDETYVWAPSAVRGGGDTALQQTQFYFAAPGDYTVTVEPRDDLSYNYWGRAAVDSWMYHAPWLVSVASGCAVEANAAEGHKAGGSIIVYCYLNGQVAQSYILTIPQDQYVYPNNISGYRCAGGAQYVTLDQATGVCSPNAVHFYYSSVGQSQPQIAPAPTPAPTQAPVPQAVIPYEWDTQFKPETSQSNPTCWRSLPYLYDGDVGTSFFYTIWSSELNDAVPEITAYFNGETVSAIGIINGKASMSSLYQARARACNMTLRIFSAAGTEEVTFRAQDLYSQDFQVISLGKTYQGVTKIEIFIFGFYIGEGTTKYEMNISEMQFYP